MPRPPGRLRSAWHVLMGMRVTPLQQRVEWLEYKMIFEDILVRFGAQLARGVQAEKKRLKKNLDPPSPAERPVPADHKAAVRAKVAGMGLAGRNRVMAPTAAHGNGDGDDE